MQDTTTLQTESCSFAGIRPVMADLPYPPIKVSAKNPAFASLLNIDYCGSVSELSAITQYINNENRISCEHCSIAKTFLGIAMAEMMHLQKLGELIQLLGGSVSYASRQPNGHMRLWTPEYLTLPDQVGKMVAANIEAEQAAIQQYQMHRKMIRDEHVDAVLARIIKDEEYHIFLLRSL